MPVHVHVRIQQRKIKVELHLEANMLTLLFKKVKSKEPLTERDASEISVFSKAYHKESIEDGTKYS